MLSHGKRGLKATDIFFSDFNIDVKYQGTQKHFKVKSTTIPKVHLLFLKFKHGTVATSGYWYKIKNTDLSSLISNSSY